MFSDARKDFVSDPKEAFAFTAMGFVMLIIGYIPSILFRVSFKATSLAYLPLLWVAHTSRIAGYSLKWRLDRLINGEIEKARRKLSAFVLGLMAAKAAFLTEVVGRKFIEDKIGDPALAEAFLFHWPWWHTAIVFDALITFCLLFYADWLTSRLSGGQTVKVTAHLRGLALASFARSASATITVLYFFGVAILLLYGSELHA